MIYRCAVVTFSDNQGIGYDALLQVYKRNILYLGKYVTNIIDSFFHRVP